MSAGIFAASAVAAPGYHGLRALPTKQPFATKNSVARSSRTVSNGSKTFCMKVI
jgi:ribulose-bisphosphate carboxylase small chain